MKKTAPVFFILRAAVGALFVYSGFTKLMEPSSNFVGVVLGYGILGVRQAVFAAAVLPWTELLAGIFLALGLWGRQASSALAALCLLFFAAITSTYVRHIPLQDCGCFGQGPHTLPLWGTLLLDVTLFLVLTLLIWRKEEARWTSLDAALKA